MPRFQVDTRADFSGGLNAQASPWTVEKTQVLRTQNLLFDRKGAMRTRDGYAIIDPNAAAGYTHRDFAAYVVVNTGVTGLVITNNPAVNGGANQLYRNNPTPWTAIGNLQQNYELARIIFLANFAIMTDAYTTPKAWNGTTFTTLVAGAGQTVPIGALWAVSHLNQLWVWNTAPTRTALDGPASLRASDVASPNVWPNGNQTFLGDDSDKGMGLAVFSIAEEGIAPFPVLVAFKGYTAYKVTGTFGASNFAIEQIRTDQGCAAGRTIQFIPGMGILRLTQRGFYLYDGLNDQLISTALDPYLFGTDGLDGLDEATLYRSVAALYPYPPLYVCACPVAGITRRWFVLDIVRKVWSVFDLVSPTGTGLTALNYYRGLDSPVAIGPAVLRGGFSGDKNIYDFSGAWTTDAGTPIRWSVRVPPIAGNSPLRRHFHRRMLAKVYRVNQGQAVTASFAIGPAQNPSLNMAMGQAAFTTAQPGATLLSAVEEDLNFPIGRTGEVQWCELAGQGPIEIRALEWQGVPKVPSRPVRT